MENVVNKKEITSVSLEDFIAQGLYLEKINQITQNDLEKEGMFLFHFYRNWGNPEKIMENKSGFFELSLHRYIFKDNNKHVFPKDVSEMIKKYYEDVEGVVLEKGNADESFGLFSVQNRSVDNKFLLFININSIGPFFFIIITSFYSPLSLPS